MRGFYVKDELKIEYNEQEYFISKDLFDRIQKRKKIQIERLGISWIEFYDKKYIDDNQAHFLFDNIKHLKDKDEFICILTGRAYRDRHGDILNKLRLKLLEWGIPIYKIYFVSDRFYYNSDVDTALNKCHILLEHLVGVKIKDNKFVNLKQDWFSNVHFYDDEIINIDYADNIQLLFDRVIKNTEDDTYKYIIENIKNVNLQLYTHLITNNLANPFKSSVHKLNLPIKFPISESKIMRFDNF